MSSKYKFYDSQAIYFVTSSVVGWADVFNRDSYRNILLDSFRFCQQKQWLNIHSWVLMPIHFRMICFFRDGYQPGMVLKNIKSFTAIKIIDPIINIQQESLKDWLLSVFEQHGKHQKSNFRYQFWQHENHPILLDSKEMYMQRMHYLHVNPVRADFVKYSYDWLHSSATDYYLEPQKGLLALLILE